MIIYWSYYQNLKLVGYLKRNKCDCKWVPGEFLSAFVAVFDLSSCFAVESDAVEREHRYWLAKYFPSIVSRVHMFRHYHHNIAECIYFMANANEQ